MKKVIVLLVALIGISGANAQGCLPSGITFSSQILIDNFQANFPGCTEIEGYVVISDSYTGNITNLNGLNVVTAIGGGLFISFNDSLTSLSGLESLTSIGGQLSITYNYDLSSLSGLESLASIGGDLEIEGNDALTSLSGLESLPFITGNLYIINNYDLTSLSGLESLTYIPGNLLIRFNGALTSLTGLESLASIWETLYIMDSYALTSLSGLESLTSIGEDLWIYYNDALTSLSGLESLASIGGDLEIEGNDALTSLSGLENINAATITDLLIGYNYSLSTCEVQSVCDYLSSPNGTVIIEYNAPGCNSQEEVEEACMTTVEDIKTENGLTIIPNPSKDKITVSSTLITSDTQLSIFNVRSEKVIEMQLTDTEIQIDISALPRGVYFVRLQNEKMVEVGKMVKE